MSIASCAEGCSDVDGLADAVVPALLLRNDFAILWQNNAMRPLAWLLERSRPSPQRVNAQKAFQTYANELFGDIGLGQAAPSLSRLVIDGTDYTVIATPAAGDDSACRILFVPLRAQARDRDKPSVPLTPVEAELVRQLAAGKNVREASATLRISYHTGRKYLQTIFRKYNVRRQAELMAASDILTHPAVTKEQPPSRSPTRTPVSHCGRYAA